MRSVLPPYIGVVIIIPYSYRAYELGLSLTTHLHTTRKILFTYLLTLMNL